MLAENNTEMVEGNGARHKNHCVASTSEWLVLSSYAT